MRVTMNKATSIEYDWTRRDIETEQSDIPYLIKENKSMGRTKNQTVAELRKLLAEDFESRIENDYFRDLLHCLSIDFDAIATVLVELYW